MKEFSRSRTDINFNIGKNLDKNEVIYRTFQGLDFYFMLIISLVLLSISIYFTVHIIVISLLMLIGIVLTFRERFNVIYYYDRFEIIEDHFPFPFLRIKNTFYFDSILDFSIEYEDNTLPKKAIPLLLLLQLIIRFNVFRRNENKIHLTVKYRTALGDIKERNLIIPEQDPLLKKALDMIHRRIQSEREDSSLSA